MLEERLIHCPDCGGTGSILDTRLESLFSKKRYITCLKCKGSGIFDLNAEENARINSGFYKNYKPNFSQQEPEKNSNKSCFIGVICLAIIILVCILLGLSVWTLVTIFILISLAISLYIKIFD